MTEDKPDARAERLKAALRANLRRRKAQERGRNSPDKPPAGRDDAPQEER
ncbi:hypothetical protein [Methylobacterium persicinum]|uniref:DUF4169 domain-containing protein n=1 Tax=Methylobacterium persicinum TaxID=374426 RepID=A0ABU0HH36_9HYPH|nr:hypothetical protein [Methylobacterium persicinum]MDQ0441631.1 hypothetical protein [Methylobacterium persicinum]GJE39393.1 hypothetical protein KHHGKMAE_3475 [Methylobacterium persicinum]